MGKKSNLSKMRKQNSIICGCLLIVAYLSGCGMPGPLYQTPEKPPTNTAKPNEKEPSKEQQEK